MKASMLRNFLNENVLIQLKFDMFFAQAADDQMMPVMMPTGPNPGDLAPMRLPFVVGQIGAAKPENGEGEESFYISYSLPGSTLKVKAWVDPDMILAVQQRGSNLSVISSGIVPAGVNPNLQGLVGAPR